MELIAEIFSAEADFFLNLFSEGLIKSYLLLLNCLLLTVALVIFLSDFSKFLAFYLF